MASSRGSSTTSHCNMLYVLLMEQCKCAEKNKKLVQDVTCVQEPMAVLCCKQQMNDLVQFFSDPLNFVFLG